jgi:hypothetical protein
MGAIEHQAIFCGRPKIGGNPRLTEAVCRLMETIEVRKGLGWVVQSAKIPPLHLRPPNAGA